MPLKNIRFDLDDPVDKKLYEWLKTLQHGDFSLKTKKYWLEQMKKGFETMENATNCKIYIEENGVKKLMDEYDAKDDIVAVDLWKHHQQYTNPNAYMVLKRLIWNK